MKYSVVYVVILNHICLIRDASLLDLKGRWALRIAY